MSVGCPIDPRNRRGGGHIRSRIGGSRRRIGKITSYGFEFLIFKIRPPTVGVVDGIFGAAKTPLPMLLAQRADQLT